MKNISLYGPDEVRALLDYDGCIAAVRAAMKNFTADGIPQPLRNIVTLAPEKLFGVMPGTLSAPAGFGAKVLSVFSDDSRPGRSSHQGVVLAFERKTGALTCIADAGEITKIRTASASAVATDALARRDASRLAVFGCGEQAHAHVLAISCVRKLDVVLIWGRSLEAASKFAAHLRAETGLEVKAIGDGREAAAAADIICTVTTSATPVLLGEWVQPGTHVNAVGSSHPGPVEVDSDLVVRSRYVADSRRSALAAAAEFLDAKAAGLIDDAHIVAEIGEVLLGRTPGRTSPQEITFYKSLGHIVQDLAAVEYVHSRAQQVPT
jgi:ornithine cyclodeaminase